MFGTSVPSAGSTMCQVYKQFTVLSRLRCWCQLC